jgi:hypothetical protein
VGITGIASTTSKAYCKGWMPMRSITIIGSEIRESKTIATFALSETRRILRGFASISTPYLDCPINVRSKVNYELDAAPSIGSTVGRELMYAVTHAIHHYALIAVMCGMLEVSVPVGFGVAPSTLKYHAEQPKAA